MDQIILDDMKKIKKIMAAIMSSCCLVSSVSNLIGWHKDSLFNAISIALIAVFILVTAFVDKKIMYILQVGIVLIVGILAIIFEITTSFIGDLLILLGITLASVYRLMTTFSYKRIIIIIIGLTLYKGFASNFKPYIMLTALVSSTIVLLIWTMVKNLIDQYVKETQKNESLARIGMNAGNFLHNMHMATALHIIAAIKRNNDSGNHQKISELVTRLQKWINEKTMMRNKILYAISMNRTTTKELINLHDVINAVIETMFFNVDVYTSVKINTDFVRSDLFIKAVPFEMYYIFQNLFSNAIEAMLAIKERSHQLDVLSKRKGKKLIIAIRDTGPGFQTEKDNINLSSAKPTGGYGSVYIKALMSNYYGKVVYHNLKPYGAEVTLIFNHRVDKAGSKESGEGESDAFKIENSDH